MTQGRALALPQDNLVLPVEQFTRVGLQLPEGLPFERWDEWGQNLQHMEGTLSWCWGDWCLYGGNAYGDKWQEARALSGREYQTLVNLANVAKTFEFNRRRLNLSWRHHAEVAGMKLPGHTKDNPMPDEEAQDYWLDLADKNKWSAREMRMAIRDSRLSAKLQERLKTAPGQALIVQSDALAWLQSLAPQSADLLLTDPPYMTDVENIEAFAEAWVPSALSRLKPSAQAYIFTGAYPAEIQAYLNVLRRDEAFEVADLLVWTYRNTLGPSPASHYKLNWQAVFYLRGPAAPPLNCPEMVEQFAVQDINAPDGRLGDRLHTWQKPEEIAERFIRHSTPAGGRMIDPFAGTGTFPYVAARLGLEALGCEQSPDMLDLCVSRGLEVVLEG